MYDYSNDALGRRTSMGKSGTAFPAADTISYAYNDRSEVISANSAIDPTYDYGYSFDKIGNRISSHKGTETRSYTTNNLNQYTAITNPTQAPSYDEDGNMLTLSLASGEWVATYNGENRLAAIENSSKRLEFSYDYMGRRVEKKVYSGSVGNWVLDEHSRFVYDGYLQVEKLDALNSNAVIRKRIWSDGKIISDIHGSTPYYSLGDANKNLTEYLGATGAIAAHFEYSPFGKLTKSSGSMADDFNYQFSSEYADSETGMIYYNYRYYSPELGRWITRDPIGEMGGENTYVFVDNAPMQDIDFLGLWKELKLPATESKCTMVIAALDTWAVGFNQTLLNHWINGNGEAIETTMGNFNNLEERLTIRASAIRKGLERAKQLECKECNKTCYGNFVETETRKLTTLLTYMIFNYRLTYTCSVNYSKRTNSKCKPVQYCSYVRCNFEAKDHVNFWSDGSIFIAPPFKIHDNLVRACIQSGTGFDVTAKSTTSWSFCEGAGLF